MNLHPNIKSTSESKDLDVLFHSVMGESGRNKSDFVYCPNL